MENSKDIEIEKDENGVEQVLLRNPSGASVRVSLYGGQVLSWKTDHGEELLFMSSEAIFKPPTAARGGIPIFFPQFGKEGVLELARNRMWVIDNNPPPLHPNNSNGETYTDLLLKSSDDDLEVWPHGFEFRLRVALALDGSLALTSRIKNISCEPFSFSIAYHTYFHVSDVSDVRVEGLEHLDYLDNLFSGERFTEQGNAVTFDSEVDRVYLSAVDEEIAVYDHSAGNMKTFLIKKEGLPDVVVWNPWEEKSVAIEDLGNEEYEHMVCVGGAAIEEPITLNPGEEWTGKLELSLKCPS